MNKLKLMVLGGGVVAIAAVSILAAQAATPLTAACAGSVSGNVVTWTATSTGGNAPYTFLWGGDTSVAGATTTSMNVTYGTNGTYNATIQVTDASSSVATSTCAATVTANVVPTATSTLNVAVAVNNTAGGLAVPGSFTVSVSGAGATPSSFAGTAGTLVVVNASTTYVVGASSIANYTASMSGNCTGPIAAGASASCTVTETFVPPTTATTTLPKFNEPMLNINPGGHFLARGMVVTSVGTNSFQGMVWGITYTVNWNGHIPEAFFRVKNSTTTNPANILAVGDEVGVSGKIDASAPFVVNADVVRDYSIIMARPNHGEGNGNGKGNEQGENEGNKGTGGSTSATINAQNRLSDLLNQLKNLQDLFKGKGHGGN